MRANRERLFDNRLSQIMQECFQDPDVVGGNPREEVRGQAIVRFRQQSTLWVAETLVCVSCEPFGSCWTLFLRPTPGWPGLI